MENATKALIIAGSVLIALVLIGVSVAILGSLDGVDDNVKSTSEAIAVETFNSKFITYVGIQSRAQVNTLLSYINSSNLNSEHDVKVYLNDSEQSNISTLMTSLANNSYTVEIKSYDADGYITGINIK